MLCSGKWYLDVDYDYNIKRHRIVSLFFCSVGTCLLPSCVSSSKPKSIWQLSLSWDRRKHAMRVSQGVLQAHQLLKHWFSEITRYASCWPRWLSLKKAFIWESPPKKQHEQVFCTGVVGRSVLICFPFPCPKTSHYRSQGPHQLEMLK